MKLFSKIQGRANTMGVADLLSTLSGVPNERLEALRDGAAMSALEFEALCRAVVVNPAELVYGDNTEFNPRRSVARFRSAPGVQSLTGADLRVLQQAAEVGRVLGGLARVLNVALPVVEARAVLPASGTDQWKKGYQLGTAARKRLLRNTSEPIAELERTLTSTLAVHVAHVRFENEQIDAASLFEDGAVPVVLVNATGRGVRSVGGRRAAIAHELCHLLHDGGQPNVPDYAVSVAYNADGYSDLVEQRARAFAPAFLAPPSAVRAWKSARFGQTAPDTLAAAEPVVASLADHWGFSFEGAAWHAKNCRLVSSDLISSLLAQPPTRTFPERGFEVSAPSVADSDDLVAPIWRGLGERLVMRAAAQSVITSARARELLRWA